jgi:uncharacterized protein YbaR (Trm112 family)
LLKPGPKKLFNYLLNRDGKKAKVEEVIEALQDLYIKETQVKRWTKQHPDYFSFDGDYISVPSLDINKESEDNPKDKDDMEPFSTRRNQLVKDIEQLLVGPLEEHEVLNKNKSPMALYLTGKLAPYGSTFEVISEEENDIQTKELLDTEKIDEILSNRNPFRPSSMGFSFRMKNLVPLKVNISWGFYDDENHKRKPINETLEFLPETKEFKLPEPGILRCKVRKRNEIYHVSLFLLNGYQRDSYPLQSEVMFQTRVAIKFDEAVAVAYSSRADQWNFEDELLYRHVKEYAIGHGVGVDYELKDNQCYIQTTWLPSYEVPIVEHRVLNKMNVRMMDLASMSKSDLKLNLMILPNEYQNWIQKQEDKISDLPDHLKSIAEKNIKQVEKIVTRITQGIDTLVENPIEHQAFQYANRVMAMQQAQTKVSLHYRNKDERIKPVHNGKWRLFQLAFILLNINGASYGDHKDRNVVDLLWFPTGGGKTEAYLGIAAYMIGLRRLRGLWSDRESYSGVTVMMRYTLRLLTTQQFQRATAMICAAEVIRRSDEQKWGIEPIRIGLWIGTSSTPNTITQAKEKLQLILDGNEIKEGNPIQLEYCPWCGSKLTVHDYAIHDHTQNIICNNSNCNFSDAEGIPALTIDEAIYNHVPTMLIGTVDKIAQIAWNSRFAELFGKKTHYSPIEGFVNNQDYKKNHRKNGQGIPTKKIDSLIPPQLIIQDELHLISGPLGSMTGLYEVAIDYLCQHKGHGPKIIASTATIRGAEEQVKRLYGRSVAQFPLPVVDSRENFYSEIIPLSKKPGRLYIGVCAPGVSGTIHTVHSYAAVLSSVRKSKLDHTIDPYWTILGYFNTLKELTGTSTKLKDEIPVRLKMISDSKQDWNNLYTEEMTSRKKASEIPQLLTQMEKTINEGALDVVLSTNMISVGVDVDRLGVMIMHNQPKTAAEYIQATSRVGRRYPGLVLTLYNSLRSRDLSHYERFRSFHEAMYRHVEPTSVTSYAQGSRDRGMEGLIVGMVRQAKDNLRNETGAINFTEDEVSEEILDFVQKRVNATGEINAEIIKSEVKEIYKWWKTQVQCLDKLSYRQNQYRKNHLIRDFNERGKSPGARPVLNSLRNVEAEIKVIEEKYYD